MKILIFMITEQKALDLHFFYHLYVILFSAVRAEYFLLFFSIFLLTRAFSISPQLKQQEINFHFKIRAEETV